MGKKKKTKGRDISPTKLNGKWAYEKMSSMSSH